MNRALSLIFVLTITFQASLVARDAHNNDKGKTASLKGKLFLGDKDHPVAGAVIVLIDEKKSGGKDNSVESKTDVHGDYQFENVMEGRYTVSIRTWYKSQEDAPCQLLMAKTQDKNSTVIVARDIDKFVELILIKGFSVKSGKENLKDFDMTCKSMFGG
jgi:hypothetical protein